MAPHSSTLAWKIPWTEEPGGLQSMGSLRVRHDRGLHDFTFTCWRRKWQPTPVFLPGESQEQGSLMGCRLWDPTESDTTEATAAAGEKSKCPLTGKWILILKLWYIYTMEYYSTITQKGNGLLIYTTKWINLKRVMLSKESQTFPKSTSCQIVFTWNSVICKQIYSDRSRSVLAWAWGWRKRRMIKQHEEC